MPSVSVINRDKLGLSKFIKLFITPFLFQNIKSIGFFINCFWSHFFLISFFFSISDNWTWEQNSCTPFLWAGSYFLCCSFHRFVSFWSLSLCHSICNAWDGVFIPNELIWLIFTVAAVVIVPPTEKRMNSKSIFIKWIMNDKIKYDFASLCTVR